MAGLSSAGIGSGLDVAGLVSKLIDEDPVRLRVEIQRHVPKVEGLIEPFEFDA